MIKLPISSQWKQTNSGEVFGSLHATRNIDFDDAGYLKLARKSTAILNNTSNLGSISSIQYVSPASNAGYYLMTSDRPFRYITGTTATDLNTSGLSGGSTYDGVAWQGKWYYTQDTAFRNYDGSSVSAALGSLTTLESHPMCVVEHLNQLAIGNGNTILFYDTSHTLISASTITLGSIYSVKWIVWKNNTIFIGTKNKMGGKAMMFVATGSSTSVDAGYQVDGNWLFSGCTYKSTIACVSSNGELLEFNGGGFNRLAQFPVFSKKYSWYSGTGFVNGRMSHRGMVADGDNIFLNIDGAVGNSNYYTNDMPSGLWQFDPSVGLYHKAGNGFNKLYSLTASSIDTATGIFTVSSYTSPTGTMVGYSGDAGGLITQSYYFIIRLSSTTFKLATSYNNAIAGTSIQIPTAGASSIFYFQENDEAGRVVGYNQPASIQLISDLDDTSQLLQMTRGGILYGNRQVSTDTLASQYPTFATLTKGFNIGSFITQKIFSQGLSDSWNKIFVKVKNLNEGCDKVIVKYRTRNVSSLPIVSTTIPAIWVTATQFTTTKNLTGLSVGDEFEFIDGRCSGYNVHITSLDYNGNTFTWTVGIDETLPNVVAGDKSYFVADNWTKYLTSTSDSTDGIASSDSITHSKWIQLKVELRGVSSPVVEEIQVINTLYQLSK